MNKKKKRSIKLSIASLVTGILALTALPVILVLLFGISWALADSSGQPQLSDRILLYGISASGYILGLIPVILGSIDLAMIRSSANIRKARIMDITGIVLGIISILVSAIYTSLLFSVWYI